ncbi:hypothetical protein KTN05_15755 [Paracoccus sp. Z118]|uniref:hypothetical protein n=1 Tax=Paracoccus sp. Z118 TaxID=2851017 RepID=UPI001C2B880E|nr:hypothetical protein [Paracoccus sp. Z118]MBV0893269.1 hypothetical protein [Paracoccus sp. Z118]
MDDERVWRFEESLWRASDVRYRERVDPDCIMSLSRAPHIFAGRTAVDAVSQTPEWDEVAFAGREVRRPEEGLIVIGYRVAAAKGEARFEAACTSVYRRRGHDDWTVVQHAQFPLEFQQETPDGR